MTIKKMSLFGSNEEEQQDYKASKRFLQNLAAVEQNGQALGYVKEQTPEIYRKKYSFRF